MQRSFVCAREPCISCLTELCFFVSSAFVFCARCKAKKKRAYKALIIIPRLIIYVQTESILDSKY